MKDPYKAYFYKKIPSNLVVGWFFEEDLCRYYDIYYNGCSLYLKNGNREILLNDWISDKKNGYISLLHETKKIGVDTLFVESFTRQIMGRLMVILDCVEVLEQLAVWSKYKLKQLDLTKFNKRMDPRIFYYLLKNLYPSVTMLER